jgi:hypothetical protein
MAGAWASLVRPGACVTTCCSVCGCALGSCGWCACALPEPGWHRVEAGERQLGGEGAAVAPWQAAAGGGQRLLVLQHLQGPWDEFPECKGPFDLVVDVVGELMGPALLRLQRRVSRDVVSDQACLRSCVASCDLCACRRHLRVSQPAPAEEGRPPGQHQLPGLDGPVSVRHLPLPNRRCICTSLRSPWHARDSCTHWLLQEGRAARHPPEHVPHP